MARRYPREIGSDREQSKRARRSSGVMAGAEGEVDSLQVHSGVVGIGQTNPPYDTANKLYNNRGTIYWNGIDLTSSAAPAAPAATATAATLFTGLTDPPSSLGSAYQFVQVNSSGNALVFAVEIDGGAI